MAGSGDAARPRPLRAQSSGTLGRAVKTSHYHASPSLTGGVVGPAHVRTGNTRSENAKLYMDPYYCDTVNKSKTECMKVNVFYCLILYITASFYYDLIWYYCIGYI